MGPKLPKALLDELGVQSTESKKRKRSHNIGGSRKDQRKADRAAKRSRQRGTFQPQPAENTHKLHHERRLANAYKPRHERSAPKVRHIPDEEQSGDDDDDNNDDGDKIDSAFEADPEPPLKPKSKSKFHDIENEGKASRAVQAKLKEDDAEISRLEKMLGIKRDRKSMPKSFKEDGLDELLGGFGAEDDGDYDNDEEAIEADKWLKTKRRKALGIQRDPADEDNTDEGESDTDLDGLSNGGNTEDILEETQDSDVNGWDDDDEFRGLSEEDEHDQKVPTMKVRENPYLPPTTGRIATGAPKTTYVPPSLRKKEGNAEEAQVRQRVKRLINQLGDSNMVPILNDIDKLYLQHPRQLVTEGIANVITEDFCNRDNLGDAFVINVATLIAAATRLVGIDFIAHFVQHTYQTFGERFQNAQDSRETKNMISLISAMYSIDVIGPRLVYDYIRFLLDPENFTENNTELILRIIGVCGPKLRKDDPSALQQIIAMVKPAVDSVGANDISVRTKFMIDTMHDLRSNHPRTKTREYSSITEKVVRAKKTLANIKATKKTTDPLNLGFEDLGKAGSKGQWWRVGARWYGNGTAAVEEGGAGEEEDENEENRAPSDSDDSVSLASAGSVDSEPDLLQLAQVQGMNTAVRRSIFAAIMSGLDVDDGYRRLQGLRLNTSRQKEVPAVLIQCVGSESEYNMYYAHLAKRFCAGHQMQYSFKVVLWQSFRKMGEGLFGELPEGFDDEDDEEVSSKWDDVRITNTARLFGVLVSEGMLPLACLKALDMLHVGEKARNFLVIMIVSALLPLPEKSDRVYKKLKKGAKSGEEVVQRMFDNVDTPDLMVGLLDLVKRARKFQVPDEKKYKESLKWACRVAKAVLEGQQSAVSE